MNNTRTLLKENTALAHEIAGDLIKFKPVLADLKRAYDTLELGAFNQEIFKKLILTGATDTINFYVTTLNDQLDRLGITSSTMRQNTITGHDNIIQTLNQAIAKAKSFRPEVYSSNGRPKLSLKFISFTDRFTVSDEDLEGLLETYCRIYLEEHEKPLFEIAHELETAYNKLLKIVEEQKIISGTKLNFLNLILSENPSGKVGVDAGKLKGLITYNQRRVQYNSI